MMKRNCTLALFISILLVTCTDPNDPQTSHKYEPRFIDSDPRVMFVGWKDDNQDVFTVKYDGSLLTRLTTDENMDIGFEFSPNGNTVLFLSRRIRESGNTYRNNLGVYVMNIDGSGQTVITDQFTSSLSPSFFPLGDEILFVGSTFGPENKIYSIDISGENLKEITPTFNSYFEPKISSDGMKITFSISNDYYTSSIYVMDVDGSLMKPLASELINPYSPKFSPDGSKIIFFSEEDLFLIDTSGQNLMRLTNNNFPDKDACFSPDGSKIVFSSQRYDIHQNYELYVMQSDGSGESRLTIDSPDDDQPVYTQDGAHIIYHSGQTIRIMDSDGSNSINLLAESGISSAYSPVPRPFE